MTEFKRPRRDERGNRLVWWADRVASLLGIGSVHMAGPESALSRPRYPSGCVTGAADVVKATAERDGLAREYDAFLQERLSLVQRLRKNLDRAQAVAELQAFDGNVELVKADIPDADQAVADAWTALDATIGRGSGVNGWPICGRKGRKPPGSFRKRFTARRPGR